MRKSEFVSRPQGWVYVLTNRAMPGLVKIGRTTRDPAIRLREINGATGVPLPFDIACAVRADDVIAVERQVHKLLQGKRVNKRREFFRCTPEEAEQAAHAASRMYDGRYVRGGAWRKAEPPSILSFVTVVLPVSLLCHRFAGTELAYVFAALSAWAFATGKPVFMSDFMKIPQNIGPLPTLIFWSAMLISYRHDLPAMLADIQRLAAM